MELNKSLRRIISLYHRSFSALLKRAWTSNGAGNVFKICWNRLVYLGEALQMHKDEYLVVTVLPKLPRSSPYPKGSYKVQI